MNSANLNLYYIFYTVASCGNISTAAKQLYISQPAISKAISKLESSLGTVLFTRSSRGVKLTEEGEMLYTQAQIAFHSIEQGEEQLRQGNELGVGSLSIGVSTTLCKYVLIPYLQDFIKENPHIKISISCQSTYETISNLESGNLDIGLIGESDKANGLCFHPVKEIKDVFVTTKSYLDHLKVRTESVSLSEATLLLLNKGNITRQYIDQFLMSQKVETGQILEVSTMDLLIEFAKIGLGVACVIENFVEKDLQDGTLIPFPMTGDCPPRKIGFAYSKTRKPSLAMNKFFHLVTAKPL